MKYMQLTCPQKENSEAVDGGMGKEAMKFLT